MKVLSLVERGGNVRSIRVESVSRPVVEAIVKANVDHESRLMTDEAAYYPRIGRHFAGHESVNHSADEWRTATRTPIHWKGFSRSSSAGCAACTSTAASNICIVILLSSTFDTTSGPRSM
jgi:ISXO2-like transposase domain